jgi:hypothetical protein
LFLLAAEYIWENKKYLAHFLGEWNNHEGGRFWRAKNDRQQQYSSLTHHCFDKPPAENRQTGGDLLGI